MLDTLQDKLTAEELTGLQNYIGGEVAKGKEGLLSKEDFDKQLQSETDKVRTKYTQERKALEEELNKYKPIVKTDAEKALEAKLAELEAKEKEMSAKEKQLKLQDTLSANNLPKSLYKYVQGDDAEAVAKEIANILSTHMSNNAYKPTAHKPTDTNITKEQFKAMSYSQRAELYSQNPELYKKLSN